MRSGNLNDASTTVSAEVFKNTTGRRKGEIPAQISPGDLQRLYIVF